MWKIYRKNPLPASEISARSVFFPDLLGHRWARGPAIRAPSGAQLVVTLTSCRGDTSFQKNIFLDFSHSKRQRQTIVVSIVSGRLWVSSMFRCILHLPHTSAGSYDFASHPTIIDRSSISAFYRVSISNTKIQCRSTDSVSAERDGFALRAEFLPPTLTTVSTVTAVSSHHSP